MIEVTDRGLASSTPSGVRIEEYYSRSAASGMSGLHEDSLGRLWRGSGHSDESRIGLRAGHMLYFSASDMESLLGENAVALERFQKAVTKYRHEGGSNGR